jgi:hypothetical protein
MHATCSNGVGLPGGDTVPGSVAGCGALFP